MEKSYSPSSGSGIGDRRGLEQVDACVYGVGEDLPPGRLLQKTRDAPVLLGYDDAEIQGVLDALEDHRGLGALLLVELDEPAQVGVGQGVAANDEQALALEAELLLGHLHGARGPRWRVLDGVADVYIPVRTVAEVVPYLIRHELQGDGDIREAVALEELHDVLHARGVDDGNHRLGLIAGQGPQTRSLPPCHYDRLHRRSFLAGRYRARSRE